MTSEHIWKDGDEYHHIYPWEENEPEDLAAHNTISEFLTEELGSLPSFKLMRDGIHQDGRRHWAFWILDHDSTSYACQYDNGIKIEWLGTSWNGEEDEL